MMNLGVAAGLDMFAARTVAGFAAGFADHRRIFKMNPRVGTGGKFPDDLRVAVHAGLVADVMGAGNFQRHHHFAGRGGAGIQKKGGDARSPQHQMTTTAVHTASRVSSR